MSVAAQFKDTIKHALTYLGGSVVRKAVGFLMLPIYAHKIGAEGYGLIGMLDMLIMVLAMPIGNTVTQAIQRLYFERDQGEQRNSLITSGILFISAVSGGLSLLLVVGSKPLAAFVLGSATLSHFIQLASIAFFFEMGSKAAESYILIHKMSLFYSVLSVFSLILGLSLNIYFIVNLNLGVVGFLYSAVLTSLFNWLVMTGFVLTRTGLTVKSKDIKQIADFIMPLLPGYISLLFSVNIDRVLIRAILGVEALGVYQMLYKFVDLIPTFITDPYNKIWRVKRLELLGDVAEKNAMNILSNIYLLILMGFSLLLAINLPIGLQLLTPQVFWLSGTIIALAVTAKCLWGFAVEMNFGLISAKKTGIYSNILIGVTVVNFVASLILVPSFGLMGAVCASCLVYTSQFLLNSYHSKKYYQGLYLRYFLASFAIAALILTQALPLLLGEEGIWFKWVISLASVLSNATDGFLSSRDFSREIQLIAEMLIRSLLAAVMICAFFIYAFYKRLFSDERRIKV